MTDDAFMLSPDRGCAPGKTDINLFFTERAPNTAKGHVQIVAKVRRDQARTQCRRFCPFTQQCFAWAEENGQRYGFWGGVDMASEVDRAKHRDLWGIAAPATRQVSPIDLVLAGKQDFADLSADDQVTLVTTALEQGTTYETLARRFGCTPVSLRLLAGDQSETFDEKVLRLYQDGKSDRDIGLSLGVNAKTVSTSRARQELPALYGPGGRELTPAGRDKRAARFQQQDLVVKQGYAQGLSDEQIAEQNGLTYDQVKWIRAKRLGLASKDQTNTAREERKALVRQLYDEGLPDTAIAARLNVSASYVNRIRGEWLGLPPQFGSHGKRIAAAGVPA